MPTPTPTQIQDQLLVELRRSLRRPRGGQFGSTLAHIAELPLDDLLHVMSTNPRITHQEAALRTKLLQNRAAVLESYKPRSLRGRDYTTGTDRDESPRDVYTGKELEI